MSLIPVLLACACWLALILWARREDGNESRARELEEIASKLLELQRDAELLQVAMLMDPRSPVSVSGGAQGVALAWLHTALRCGMRRGALGVRA